MRGIAERPNTLAAWNGAIVRNQAPRQLQNELSKRVREIKKIRLIGGDDGAIAELQLSGLCSLPGMAAAGIL